jgi:hypothetical protein
MSQQISQSQQEGAITRQVALHADEVRKLAGTELNFFAALCIPDVCTFLFPSYYVALWMQLLESLHAPRNFDRFALGFPRGHGKTIIVKLLVAYAVLYTTKRFVLVVCANQERAKDVLRDVCDILSSDNVVATFGNWREQLTVDRAEFKQFVFNGRIIVLAAAGCGTSLRGMNVGFARPDVIVCDDAQTRECAMSIQESLNYVQWFFATLMKAKSPYGCTYLYVGNMYRDLKARPNLYCCLLRNLQRSPSWRSYIVGAILSDGSALWEELHPRTQLLQEFHQDNEMGQGEVYAAEVLNDPTYVPNSGLREDMLKVRDSNPEELHQGNFIVIDPAGFTKKSDFTAIGYFELYDGVPTLTEVIEERLSPSQTIFRTLELALRYGCGLVCAEAVAYQSTLLYWFTYICAQQTITGIEFQPVFPGIASKNARILLSFKSAMAGELAFTPETYAIWVSRAKAFDARVTNNVDDVLDLTTYAPKCVEMYGHMMAVQGESNVVAEQLGAFAADDSISSF